MWLARHTTPRSHTGVLVPSAVFPSILNLPYCVPGSTLHTTELQDIFPLLDNAANDNDTADDCYALWVNST